MFYQTSCVCWYPRNLGRRNIIIGYYHTVTFFFTTLPVCFWNLTEFSGNVAFPVESAHVESLLCSSRILSSLPVRYTSLYLVLGHAPTTSFALLLYSEHALFTSSTFAPRSCYVVLSAFRPFELHYYCALMACFIPTYMKLNKFMQFL